MKKIFASLLLLAFCSQDAVSQTKLIRPKSIGVSFILNDFITADRIRKSSLSSVIINKQFAKIKEMNPGLAINYFKGVLPHIDFAASLTGSFADRALPGKITSGTQFLLEADASVNLKMFTDNYWVSPYLIAGVGASKFSSYFGAFIPLGGGVNINLPSNTIYITLQYRVPVTGETINYHFLTSIGISGLLGKKRM
jgi:hypothetical protein